MMAGYERYYQIARCFRDEDTRADRQPEFTQLDLEMAFVTEEEVLETTEAVMSAVFAAAGFPVADPPWPQLRFAEAMARYGSDRPDTRFGLEIHDVSDVVRGSEFKVFESVLAAGGSCARSTRARAISRAPSRTDCRRCPALRRESRCTDLRRFRRGLQRESGEVLLAGAVEAVLRELSGSAGDLLLFVADQEHVAARALGALRLELAERFGLIDRSRHDVLFVRDFPMFEWSEGEDRWTAMHHPFTAPVGDDFTEPAKLLSRGYDLVCDGVELGGGSIRINTPEVQEQVFKVIGLSEQDARERFGFLLDALCYGAPPHGGIALGIDRIVAICAGARRSAK